jgi:tetratricopeptide (TPR) repeat protein
MATEVYEDRLDLEIDVLEAVPLHPSLSARADCYPYPFLKPTGHRQTKEFGTIIIENPYLRATIVPELGGRVLRLFDKRTGLDVLGDETSLKVSGGQQDVLANAWLPYGLGSGLGPVDYQVLEAAEEGDSGGIVVRTHDTHIAWSLPPDRAELQVEVRNLNRSFNFSGAGFELPLWVGGLKSFFHGGLSIYAEGSGSGLVLETGRSSGVSLASPNSVILKSSTKRLGPRQLDRWSCSVVPISGFDTLTAANKEVALSLDEGRIKMQVSERRLGHKILLLTADGQTLEAPADLHPEQMLELETGLTAAPRGVVVLDPERNEVFRYEQDKEYQQAPEATEEPLKGGRLAEYERGIEQLMRGQDPVENLTRSSAEMAVKSASLSSLGVHSLRNKNYPEAVELFENALLYNSEDHLTWWMKAMAHRLAGEEETGELLNAHFLAPLEPVLRAESFLRQNEPVDGPSPMVAPMADDPDAMVEVACWIYVCGNFADLSRWNYEVQKHRHVPMVRYIYAAALLEQSAMKAEAAQEVHTASKAPINPPYPWRATERRVLMRLLEAFPTDPRLKELLSLVEWGRPTISAADF